jgi:type I restriction enzyme, S subunit
MSESHAIAPLPRNWQRTELGEICRSGGGSIQTGPFGSQLHAEDYKEDGVPIITVEHLREGKISHENLPLVGAADRQRLSRYSLASGDLVFSRVGAIDRCALVSEAEDGWLFSGRCLRVRPGRGKVDPLFLSYRLNSWPQRQWILNHSVGSTMKCLNTAILSGVPVDLPSFSEQRGIAKILSTLDDAIMQTDAIVAKYQLIKTGLMHDLFARGVTPDGRLRPPRSAAPKLYKQSAVGWIPREWETVAVGEVFDRRVERGEAGLPVMAITMRGGLVERESVDRRVDSGLGPEGHLLVRAGDIAYNMMRMWQGVLGRATYDCLVSPAYIVLRPSPVIDSVFAEYLFSTDEAIAAFKRRSYGVVDDRLRLYFRDLVQIRFAIPVVKDEQLMIAKRLAQTDEKIQEARAVVAKLREQKRGLMSDLLTGRVPVAVQGAAS